MEPSPELKKVLSTIREFIEKEIIPLEPLFLDHQYDEVMTQMKGLASLLGKTI